ncbi:L-fuculose-phosphate aldolase [Anaerosalibacter bizertensis]|uniref:L-fuculose-phosphate aldolase n=1 Tax=Anaerosalibacter bizertensis TaxID=932217 RepID=A0A9Q4AB13_9FIRM|nr:L-fuculose-phosphate aldolase [Anaerosalibacter bizertensis]MBV1819370.1 L-fuculose-phosphate aldolase [Bacteroidales bacterium MSK.15.36]MCB5558828.1 L-fuculose-phosphate aldolase [Anaerosalibacter bizertensis]MCG4564164.1 L-fuculose-phosphate aldolase [Anaerosalibacter bizertensis]MCG4581855.1 L-fuculose-phosphate aldolase [Anaerosalibacter bizertensis]MCG4584720.1 L-fuculose-phosphate aldolase [Anaerosalibacter bizertensis]
MLMKNEREQIVEYGKKLIDANLTKGTGGNLSIFNREKQLMAISPSGIDYFKIKAEDVVILDLEGNKVDGDKSPSSEYEMHRIFYENRRDIDAIIHTHTMYATTIACLNWELPPVHYMVALAGLNVRCAKYATYGTKELAENAFEAMKDRNAVLLANHGLLAGAKDLANAFNITEEIEYCAELYYRTKCIGEPVILSEEEMTLMLDKFKTYGQVK